MEHAIDDGQRHAGGGKEVWTLGRIMDWSARFLKDKGITSARLDVELLLSHCLNVKRIELYTNYDRPLTPSERDSFKDLLRQRAAGTPVAYIIGVKNFMGLDFRVTPDVLIPRSDTEVIVETVLAEYSKEQPLKVLDVGLGSGCLAIALAHYLPQAEVAGWEVTPQALAVAQENADRLLTRPVMFGQRDALLAESWQGDRLFDLVVSNPPYIATDDPEVAAEVRAFEPERALFASDHGLAFYKTFATHAGNVLKPDGRLLVEIGYQQGNSVREIFQAEGWREVTILPDLSGHDRVISALSGKSEAS